MSRSLTHRVFGELRWEAAFSWWFTQLRLKSGEWLDVIIDPGDEDDPLAFLGRAAQLYSRSLDAERDILQDAIQKGVLSLYEKWRQEHEPELTAEELMNQLDLVFVRLDTIAPITFSYGLGDVFGGHSLDVTVNEKLQVIGVHLAG
jgi:hypothetical protein